MMGEICGRLFGGIDLVAPKVVAILWLVPVEESMSNSIKMFKPQVRAGVSGKGRGPAMGIDLSGEKDTNFSKARALITKLTKGKESAIQLTDDTLKNDLPQVSQAVLKSEVDKKEKEIELILRKPEFLEEERGKIAKESDSIRRDKDLIKAELDRRARERESQFRNEEASFMEKKLKEKEDKKNKKLEQLSKDLQRRMEKQHKNRRKQK